MESSSQQSAVALLGLWMFFLVMGSVLVVGGCIFALYSLGRVASNLERLANGVEMMMARDAARQATTDKASRAAERSSVPPQPVVAPATSAVSGEPV